MKKVSTRDIFIVMGDINAKLGCDNAGIESVMGQQGATYKMKKKGKLLIDFCAANELVIGGTLFPHKECDKVTWVSPDRKTQNQIDNIAKPKKEKFITRCKSDLRARRGLGPPLGHGQDRDQTGKTCKEKVWEDSL